MFSSLNLKLIGLAIAAASILSFVLLAFHWKNTMTERGEKLATICQMTRTASEVPKLKCGEVAAQIQFMGETLNAVREKTAKAQADDAAHAREVEGRQTTIGQESSHDYQAELARVRADYAERLRRAASAAHSGSGRNSPVSNPSTGARRPDAAAAQAGLPSEDALTATEQALQLKAIQDWARRVGLAGS
jgi:hypothetical protein